MCGFKGDLQDDKTFEETNAYAFKSQAEARCRNSRHLRAVNRDLGRFTIYDLRFTIHVLLHLRFTS